MGDAEGKEQRLGKVRHRGGKKIEVRGGKKKEERLG